MRKTDWVNLILTGRSATVVAAYLMHQLSISPEEAINLIREKRHIIQ